MKRVLSALLAMLMTLSLCSCGATNPQNSTVSETSGSQNTVVLETSTSETSISQVSQDTIGETVREKPSVTDFYQYALNDWLEGLEWEDTTLCQTYDDRYDEIMMQNLYDLIVGKSASDYEGNPAMQKLIMLYDQLVDSETSEKSAKHIIEMVRSVDEVKTMDDYWSLVSDPEYMYMDYIYSRKYTFTDRADYIIQFLFHPYYSRPFLSDDEAAFVKNEIIKQFVIAGYSEKTAAAKAQNVLDFNAILLDSYVNNDYNLLYFSEENYDSGEHAVPFIDFLKKMDYSTKDHYGQTVYEFFVYNSTLELYDKISNDTYLQKMKDFLQANMMNYLFVLGNSEMLDSTCRLYLGLAGYPLDKIDELQMPDAEANAYSYAQAITSLDGGHIAKLYMDTYVSPEVIDEINSMTGTIKAKYIEMLKENTWLTKRVQEKLINKIKMITVRIGEYDGYSDYSDVVIGEDAVETFFSFSDSNHKYYKSRYLSGEGGVAADSIALFSSNGEYTIDSNSVMLTIGTVQSLVENMDQPYEVRLGIFGNTLSHELAHAISPRAIGQGTDGVYMDFVTDAEYAVIDESTDKVVGLAHGQQTGNGNYFNGYRVVDELFADLLSVDCDIRILDDIENADYESFFVNYAKSHGWEATPDYETNIMKTDNHVLGSARVNIVLSQFDRFYDTFDVDENCKLYVKPENRVTGYTK